MKPAASYLGQEIQVFLLRQGQLLDAVAQQMDMSPVGLSNLIHGRRRFKDATLERLANTAIFTEGGFTLPRLRSLRAMDDYTVPELLLAVMEQIKRGQLQQLSPAAFQQIRQELVRFENLSPEGVSRLSPDIVHQLAEHIALPDG